MPRPTIPEPAGRLTPIVDLMAFPAARTARRARVAVSVLLPVRDEVESLPRLLEELLRVLDELGRPFEVIAINDGSRDGSLHALRAAAAGRREVRVIDLRRSCGQTGALVAGIDHAAGDVLVPMDADLQNDPRDIPALLAKLDEGYDVVSGWRQDRKDAPFRRNLLSRVANRIISRVFGVPLHDHGCTLKAYRREALEDVRLYGEMHRFIPVYASWQGARVTEIPVRHHPRVHGRSKYGLGRVVKVALDVLVVCFLDRYFTKPIYVFGSFGLLLLALAAASAVGAAALATAGTGLLATPLPLLAALAFVAGATSILMGLLAEMLARTYFESQEKRVYAVRERINFE